MAYTQAEITKLNSSNYLSWSNDIKYVLMERHLWKLVSGQEKKPKLVPVKEVPTEKLETDKADKPVGDVDPSAYTRESLKEVKEFEKNAEAAMAIIYLNVETEFRRIIEGYDDPVLAWETLKHYFQPDSRSQEITIFTNLFECHINDKEPVAMYASRLQRIYEQLRNLDPEFKEKYLCFQLIRFLPRKFDSIVQTVLRWDQDKFIFKDILNEFIAEETRLRLRDVDINRNTDKFEVHSTEKPESRQPRYYENRKPKRPYKDSKEKVSRNEDEYRLQNRRKPSYRNAQSRSNSRNRQLRPRWYIPPARNYGNPDFYKHSNHKYSFSDADRHEVQYLVEANASNLKDETDWIFDTAASHHCCNNRDLFIDYQPLKDEQMAVAIKGVKFSILGKGTVKLRSGQRIIHLKNVMHSNQLRRNLISGPQLDKYNITFHGEKGIINVLEFGQIIFKAILIDGTYRIKFKNPDPNKSKVKFRDEPEISVVNKMNKFELWHRRCAHINPKILIQTSKTNSVRGLPNFKNVNYKCESCKINKFRRKTFKSINKIRSKSPLELLYADVWGPCREMGREGERYYLTIVDDFSRKTSLYPIVEKSEVPCIIRHHINRAECFLGKKVKNIRTDNGGEFVNNYLKDFFLEKGIKHELTNPYTPEQNGVVERLNQTILNGTRALLHESRLGSRFWPDAMLHFIYTWNRMVHRDDFKTPFELYGGLKPSVRHLRPFGTKAYVGIPRQQRSKLQPRAKIGTLIGYAFKTKGYRIWIPNESQVIETINVSFDEDVVKTKRSGAVIGPNENNFKLVPLYSNDESNEENQHENSHQSFSDEEYDSTDESQISSDTPEEVQPELKRVKWRRERKTRKTGPKKYLGPSGELEPRSDIYYYEEGKNLRLRSLKDIENYCKDSNILFEPSLFDFSGKETYEGVINDTVDTESSLAEGL